MAGQSPIIGIDLGTTFSAMAFINEEAVPEIISNREGERITPSVVLFDGDSPMVGTIAKAAATTSPLNVVQFIKRQMGNKGWVFMTAAGATFTPEEISALILKRLKEDAEAALGESISDAVITVPAYFNDAQRQATKDAGRIAGLNVIRMINEPTAAALAYGLRQDGPMQTVLIYDLGGGTFDVTILRIGGGEISVVATGGDKNLGGFDWDNALMTHLNEQFKAAGGPDLLEDPEQESNLRAKCELAKKTLSGRDKASVLINVRGKSVTAQVTRDGSRQSRNPYSNEPSASCSLFWKKPVWRGTKLTRFFSLVVRLGCVAFRDGFLNLLAKFRQPNSIQMKWSLSVRPSKQPCAVVILVKQSSPPTIFSPVLRDRCQLT